MRRLAFIAALVVATASGAVGEDHLLSGAQLFREGKFDRAYVEFSVAARLGAGGEASWYAAAALVKLKRSEEAIEAFAAAEQSAPDARDALLDYYRALACYDARLYSCARALLAGVIDQGGPRLDAQARAMSASISRLFAAQPATVALDWYHARGGEALRAGRPVLAAAYFEEAAALAVLRSDRYRLAEATAGVSAARAALPAKGAR